VARFEPHDEVLWCPLQSRPCRATLISIDGEWATLDLGHPDPLAVPDTELYLLAPSRRPFLEDVERALARRFQERVGLAIKRYWIDQSRQPPADDMSRLALLKLLKVIRAEAMEESQIAFADARTSLKAAYDPLLPELKVEQWCDQYRSWLEDGFPRRWRDAIVREHPGEDLDALLQAGIELHEECLAAARRLGLDEREL
jgi:hypothetical protein